MSDGVVAKTHGPAAFIDGPFDAAQKPWLLSVQARLGILIQPNIIDGEFYAQPHGYLRGKMNAKLAAREEGGSTALVGQPEETETVKISPIEKEAATRKRNAEIRAALDAGRIA